MILYLVRHGETVDNANGIVQGQLQGKLTENGIIQAQKVGERLKNIKFDAIFSSDLYRAVETTNEIAVYHPRIKVQLDKRLREIHLGVNQGKTKKELDWKREFYGEYVVPKGGESTLELYNRAYEFVRFLLQNYADKIVLAVSHSATIKAFIAIFSDVPNDKLFTIESIKNTAVTVFKINSIYNSEKQIFNCTFHLNSVEQKNN